MGVLCDRTQVVLVPSSSAAPALTDQQAQFQRWDDWRRMHDEGVPGPDGRPLRRSLRAIARGYKVEASTVLRGIRAARREREALAHAIDADD